MPYDGPYISKPCGDSKPHDRHVYYTNGWFQCLGIPVEVSWMARNCPRCGRSKQWCNCPRPADRVLSPQQTADFHRLVEWLQNRPR